MKRDDLILLYNQPATDWHAALPIGNGHLGAMVFGDPTNERIQLTEESIWAGPPVPEMPLTARSGIEEARKLIFEGRYVEAQNLVLEKVLAPRIAPRSQQPLGDLTIRFQHDRGNADLADYRRQLDLSTAIATSTWKKGNTAYHAEVFCSGKENVCIARYSASEPGKLNCSIQLRRESGAVSRCLGDDTLLLEGQASHKGAHLGVKFAGVVKAVVTGGICRQDTDTLHFVGAGEVILFVAAATDYNFGAPGSPLQGDLAKVARQRAEAAASKCFDDVRQRHIADHQKLFSRVELQLGDNTPNDQPIDVRVQAYKAGGTDTALEALQFDYGRYLMITSSPPGAMPANLQGVWNEHLAAPWDCDYHTNINIQMNYWHVEVNNLSECHLPFFDLMEKLLPSARKSAAHLGCRGAFAGVTTDAWLFTAIYGRPRYGMWVMGLAWCSQHFMEHVRFTGDMGFLEKRALPMLRECTLFLLDWLVKDPKSGKLVSGPSCSPENAFLFKNNSAILTMGCSMDQQIIWDTFTNYLEAVALLGKPDDLRSEVEKALANLAQPGIGPDGRLMEWPEPFEEEEPGHRHVSHLFGLHPGRQYTHEGTPELIAAAEKSLNARLTHGGGQTGWSRSWLINFRARLRQGEKAHEDVRAFIGKLTEANLFCTHPPFQIDGNFGYAAGVAEMLVQSHVRQGTPGAYVIHLLPALPKAWAKGSVRGLCARGGFEIRMEWDGGKMVKGQLLSHLGNPCVVRVGAKTQLLKLPKGELVDL